MPPHSDVSAGEAAVFGGQVRSGRISMVALALGLALGALVAAPGAGAEGWSAATPLGAAQFSFSAVGGAVIGGGFTPDAGTLSWPDSATGRASVSTTADGGLSWTAPVTPPGPPYPAQITTAVGAGGARVFGWAFGSGLRVLRTGPGGVPGAGFATIPGAAGDVRIAVNSAGDALIAWNIGSASGDTWVAFWPAGQSAPSAAQQLATGDGSMSGLAVVLDPGRSAVVVFGKGGKVFQSYAADAAQADAFGAAQELWPTGGTPVAAQAPDGRAIVAWRDVVTLGSPNIYGATNYGRVLAATRAPGNPFPAGQVVDGAPERYAGGVTGVAAAVAPTGQAALLYEAQVNKPGGGACADYLGDTHVALASATIPATGTGDAAIGHADIAGGGDVNANIAGTGSSSGALAAGPDGRIAAAWAETKTTCPSTVVRSAAVGIAPAGGGFSRTAPPPGEVRWLGVRPDGEIVAVLAATYFGSGALKTAVYTTGVPLAPPPSAPGATGGTVGPGVGGPAPAPTQPAKPALAPRVLKLTAKSDGTVVVNLLTDPADVRVDAYVKSKGFGSAKNVARVIVASARVKVRRSGTVRIVLKPTARARKVLRRKGSIKATLRVTATPAAGGRALVTTRAVTFKLSRERRS